jgi:hypothetical protein
MSAASVAPVGCITLRKTSSKKEFAVIRRLALVAIGCSATSAVYGQAVTFRDGVSELPGGGIYDGTIDTEFRAANPTEEQSSNEGVSIDDFDGGFQTQAAIRFENLLVSQGGLVPDQVASGQFELVFAELTLWVTSNTDSAATINFNRIVGPDTTSGDFWQEDDTWASLGGDLIPDQGGFLDGDPIAENGIEAAITPDFVVPTPAENAFTNTTTTSEDVLGQRLAAGLSLEEAIDQSYFRFNATAAVNDWLVNGTPNFGWSVNNNTGNGWDFLTSDFTNDGEGTVDVGGQLIDANLLRPGLTVIFASPGGRGDLDFDGDVDLLDYQLLLDNLAIELDGPIATGSTGDLDFNRVVDLNDFAIFKSEYDIANGAGAFAYAMAAIVPEPTSLVLLSCCGLMGGARRRR